jgi:hypothetical protein
MWTRHDPDEWEMVSHSVPCTHCGGNLSKCRGGMCNGSSGMGMQRRKPEEVARIRAERLRKEEDEILARAEAILARRNQ